MNEGGHLINISSRAGSLGDFQYTDNYPSYRLSKAGVNMFTRILAQRLKGKITVSSVHPGSVRTDMGYENAPLSPEEAAEDIFKLAYANVATGQFWYKDKNFPW
jgi:NAD(P)-dependent dehydrogenase (short-subunit alcohol dehydrogenase family)